MIQAVLFDLDETLIDSGQAFHIANRAAFGAFGLDYDEARRRTGEMLGVRVGEILTLRRAALGATESDAPLNDLLALREAHHLAVLSQQVTPMPGALEALDAVRALRVPAAIVSSSSRALIDAVVDHLGIRPYISLAVGGDDVGNGKPDPACYELAYAKLQAKAAAAKQACLVVEDSAVGVTAGLAAGMPVCLVPAAPLKYPGVPDYQLRSLLEFPALLQKLGNS